MNEPKPDPSMVLLLAIVGFALTLQQIPLSVTKDPPSFKTFPPEVAVFAAISVTAAVDILAIVLMMLGM